MSLLGRKSIAGVDIDSYEIRVAELGGTPGSARLLNAGRKLLPAGAVKEGRICDPEAVGNSLSMLWSELGIRTRDVILGVSNQDVLVRFAMLPKVAPDKVENMIRYQAQDFLPIPVADVEMDYMVTGEEQTQEGTQMKILLVAARKNMIRDFLIAFENADLNVLDIDISNLAIARVIPKPGSAGVCVAAGIGYEQTDLLLMNSKVPQLARTMPTGQAFRTDEGGNGMNDLVRSGFMPDENRDRLISMLTAELRSSISYFQTLARDAAIHKLYICGCGSRVKGIKEGLAEALGLSVEIIDPYTLLDTANKVNPVVGERTDFSICISLALRGLEG